MKFLFKITEVNKELLVKYPPAALDGQLTILLKDAVFFDEEGISLLDLAIHIAGWLKEIKANQFTDFDYSSDEYQENPVLYLATTERNYYALTSSWVETPTDNILSLAEITYCFNSFLQDLDAAVQQAYGIAFSDMRILSEFLKK
jgi:hypothetical protein